MGYPGVVYQNIQAAAFSVDCFKNLRRLPGTADIAGDTGAGSAHIKDFIFEPGQKPGGTGRIYKHMIPGTGKSQGTGSPDAP